MADPQQAEAALASAGAPTKRGRDDAPAEDNGAGGAASSEATSTTASKDGRDTAQRGNKRIKRDGKGSNGHPHDYRQDHNRGRNFDANRAELAAEGRDEQGKRLPKRKVAVLFGYCGIGYNGLQINPGVKTIEGDIFDAFCKVGAISKDNAVNPAKVALQRSARTDRGVHAAGNVLTLKLIVNAPGVAEVLSGSSSATGEAGASEKTSEESKPEDKQAVDIPSNPTEALIKATNALLPPIIRIWGITRVQGKFNARTSCDSRQYEYLLPTYVFLPPKPGSFMYGTLERLKDAAVAAGADEKTPAAPGLPSWHDVLHHPFWATQGVESSYADDIAAKKKWRMPAEQVERIRAIFNQYLGSHNFHNFTVGKEFRDRSSNRFMKALTISVPKLINGTEWVSIKIHGQSFMLHQIRKMIGLLVLIGRTVTPASLIAETFGPARIHVPKAPGLGLLLEQPLFGLYNERIAESNKRFEALNKSSGGKGAKGRGGGDDEDDDGESSVIREPIHFRDFVAEMERFKQVHIYDRIMKVEEETAEFGKWLNYLDHFTGPDFDYLNHKGSIPTHCILRVGELRREPGGQPKSNAAGTTGQGTSTTTSAGDGKAAPNPDEGMGESDDEDMSGVNAAELEG